MALNIKELFVGDSLELPAENTDYNSTDYTHHLAFITAADVFQLDATDGVFKATSAETTDWTEGVYQWVWFVKDKSLNRTVIDRGEIKILPDPTKANDFRTHAQKMIDAIEARLEGKATEDQLSVTHNGKSVTRYNTEDLTKLLNYYKAERAKERRQEARKNGINISTVKARFTQG